MNNARLMRSSLLVVLAGVVCPGAVCTITFPDGGSTDGYVALDRVSAAIEIAQSVDADNADVVAELEDRFGRDVTLRSGQAVSVNGTALAGPDANGQYTASVGKSNAYQITVNEPERGVETTSVASAGGLEITEPAAGGSASLSGFRLSWSGAQPEYQVTIKLEQTRQSTRYSETVGPFADTGSYTFDFEELADFRQDAELVIKLTRVNEVEAVNGLRSATVTVAHTSTRTVTPAP